MSQPAAGLFPNPRGEQGVLATQSDPLDVEQEFTPATSYAVRHDLEKLIRADLLGPWNGASTRSSRHGRWGRVSATSSACSDPATR